MKYRRVALLVAVASLVALPAQGQSRRLNGPLPRPGAADLLEDFAFSRDGSRLLFRGDVFEDETFELLSSPADASAPPLRLNGPLVAGGDVVKFALGVQRAAYIADQDEDEVFELFSAPLAGGAVLELSGTLVGGGDVLEFLLTPDGTSVVFLADALVDGRPEFFRVPLDGSAAPIALDPSPSADEVTSSWMAPGGTRILFVRREVTMPNPFVRFHFDRLFSLALDGSQSKALIAVPHVPRNPLGTVTGRSIADLQFSSDGRRAIYIDHVEDDEDGEIELSLNSVAVDGSQAPIVLSQGPSNYYLPFAVSPTLARAVFVEIGHLFSIALDGTGRSRLDPAGWTVRPPAAYHFALTPDGTSVVFDAQDSVLLIGVLGGRVDGSQPARLLDGPSNSSIVELAPTDTSVLYASRDGRYYEYLGFTGVYSVPLDGSAARTLLNGPALEQTGGNSLRSAPGGELVFRNSYSVEANLELYAVPQDGSLAPRRISDPMTSGRDVERYLLAPDGTGVAYRADQTLDGAFGLFRTSVSGATPADFLPLPSGPVVGDVLSYRVSPDGRSLVYLADQDTDGEFRLYHVPTSGKAGPTRVGRFTFFPGAFEDEYAYVPAGDRIVRFNSKTSQFLYVVGTAPGSIDVQVAYGRVVGPLEFTPDGGRLVFKRTQIISGTQLVSAPLDGSGMVTLFGTTGLNVLGYQITPDGGTVVFVGDVAAQGKFELFRMPIAGGAPPIRLSPALPASGDVDAFRITPDGSGVAYLAGQRTPGLFELFVVPLDRSSPARRLSGPLIARGDVADFVFTPDGNRVVYRADAAIDGNFDLFTVSLAPPARRIQRLPGYGEPDVVQLTSLARSTVQPDYVLAADGTQVVFRADVFRDPGLVPDRPELFRVPLHGGQEPTRLSRPVSDAGSVLSFELAPDRKGIVYLADERGDGVQELFGTGVFAGGAVALDPLSAFADVSAYRVTPDSTGVVYRSDRKADEVWQLYRAPIDGSGPPDVLNDRLPAGGSVQAGFVPLPDGRVVYRADQESDEVFEVFATRLPATR